MADQASGSGISGRQSLILNAGLALLISVGVFAMGSLVILVPEINNQQLVITTAQKAQIAELERRIADLEAAAAKAAAPAPAAPAAVAVAAPAAPAPAAAPAK